MRPGAVSTPAVARECERLDLHFVQLERVQQPRLARTNFRDVPDQDLRKITHVRDLARRELRAVLGHRQGGHTVGVT